jgi:hypothetical protein
MIAEEFIVYRQAEVSKYTVNSNSKRNQAIFCLLDITVRRSRDSVLN